MGQTKEEKKTLMTEIIKEKFADDPLFLECAFSEKTKDKLFPEFLEELSEGEEYSAQDAARFVNRSDANIRYYLQNLPEYIGAVKTSASYRMKYDGVYRIHLIFLFIGELNKNLKDIKVKIGEEAQFIPKRRTGKGIDSDSLDHLLIGLHLREQATAQFTEKMFEAFTDKSRKEQEISRLYIEQSKEQAQMEETIRRLTDRKLSIEGEIRRKRHEEKERLWTEKARTLEVQKKRESGIFGRVFSPVIIDKADVEPPTEEEVEASQVITDLKKDLEAIEELLKLEMEKLEAFPAGSETSRKIAALKEEIASIEEGIAENKSAYDSISEQRGRALSYLQKKKGLDLESPEESLERHLLEED